MVEGYPTGSANCALVLWAFPKIAGSLVVFS